MATITKRTNPKIGATLKSLRQERGLSLRDLASKSGISASTISRVERGEEALFAIVCDLADALEVTVDELKQGAAMKRCQLCKVNEISWNWQPFGPDETVLCFVRPGNYYCGFPAIGVCEECRGNLASGNHGHPEFVHKGQRYIMGDNAVLAIPEYVHDGLAWFEATNSTEGQS